MCQWQYTTISPLFAKMVLLRKKSSNVRNVAGTHPWLEQSRVCVFVPGGISNHITKIICWDNEKIEIGKMKLTNHNMPPISGVNWGFLCSHGQALPPHRATATWSNRWLWLDGSELSVCWEMEVTKDLMIPVVSSERPPNISVTTGANSTTASRHEAKCEVSFRWMPTSRSYPGVESASCTNYCCSKEIMCTSRVTGWSWCKVGKKMSAWWDIESTSSPGASRISPRTADWTVE